MVKAENIAYMNTTVLAYMGDAVYEVFVRERVIATGQIHADKLHHSAIKYVRAEGQAKALKSMLEELSETELALVKRARNKKITSKPKNADPITYKWATAFEALIGYLHLSEQLDRRNEIMEKTVSIIEKS
ncbi:Mini-ribonuclease 3 [Anaerovorax sp. IOR16]|uniref:Mini-ribonuclease 3 n=1 Tax=Anaerovorax sp. IOR16 TaxID=2773458 RepID=UPI0019D02CE6|nr:ribonuclease III domain-containing protein [Anaerovorax sp. IOR16]